MQKKPRTEDRDLTLARERLAAVGFIASLISHPVRNRLAALRAALELIEAGMEDSLTAEHRTLLLQEFDAFVGDFNLGINMIRSDFGALQTLSAREILADSVKEFRPVAKRMGIAIAIDAGCASDGICADRILLRQVILNLLRNAVEALAMTPEAKITLRTGTSDGRLTIEVADNGPGVPAAFYDRLFLEPVTSSSGRVGLGLSICRDAMTLMRGSIVYATPKGRPEACFRVSIPLSPPVGGVI